MICQINTHTKAPCPTLCLLSTPGRIGGYPWPLVPPAELSQVYIVTGGSVRMVCRIPGHHDAKYPCYIWIPKRWAHSHLQSAVACACCWLHDGQAQSWSKAKHRNEAASFNSLFRSWVWALDIEHVPVRIKGTGPFMDTMQSYVW